MSRPWMPLYIADFLVDTCRLSTLERGAYLLLIMDYWTHGGLPQDDKQLRRITGLTAAEWRKSKPVLQGFFLSGWRHKRLDAELTRASEISRKRSASAKIKHANAAASAPANAPANDHLLDTHARASSQSQLQLQRKKERKQDGADAPVAALPRKQKTPEEQAKTDYYSRSKKMFNGSGAQIATQLLQAKGGNIWQAMSALGAACEAGDAKSYVYGIIRQARPAGGII